MKKTICIISNIILSYFYLSTSWMLSLAALFYITALNWQASTVEAFWCVALGIIILTPIFCILGIVLSIVGWRKEHYVRAFLWQFLPFATLAVSVLFFLLPIYLLNIFA
ncbi:MAG: hypothetical protein IJD75_05285 [Clostridia bacterium]|nr:hypothetical protein [Clostridia bacterium]